MRVLNFLLIICVCIVCTHGWWHRSREARDSSDESSSEEETRRPSQNRDRDHDGRGADRRPSGQSHRGRYDYGRRGYSYGPYHYRPYPVTGPCDDRVPARPESKLRCRIEEIVNTSSVNQRKANAFRDEVWRIMTQEWTSGNNQCGEFPVYSRDTYRHRTRRSRDSDSDSSEEEEDRDRRPSSYHRGRDNPRDHHDHSRHHDQSRHRDYDRRDGRYDSLNGYHLNTTRNDYEQVPYERVCSPGSKYDIRMYSAAKWISTFVSTSSVDAARFAGYRRLNCYNSNVNDSPMNKTVPIRISIITDNLKFAPPSLLRRNERFLVSSYIPEAYQYNPPSSSPGSQVLVGESEGMQVFAFNFSGNAYGSTIYEKYFEFLQMLDDDEQDYSTDVYMFQIFDDPWIPAEERHNEILIPMRPNATQENICKYPNGIRQCAKSECPVYHTEEIITPNIILRRTEPGVYATKKSASCNLGEATSPYMDLHRYFIGNNTENSEISRTTPVMRWAARPSLAITGCDFTYELSFYLPKAFHKFPPTPRDETVVLVRQDEPTYDYVITFEGPADDVTVKRKYRELVATLNKKDYCFKDNLFEYAQYDAPWSPQPHRHEVSIPVSYKCNEVYNSFVVLKDKYNVA